MDDRNYILNRLTSKRTTIEEFDFDKLQAPPLTYFLSPYDIEQLHQIATSLRLSSHPEERYKLIDQICTSRGLVKFIGGTNRVSYRHPEFPDYIIKVATDDVGRRDNPDEFRLQYLLKPFVCKVYEISPCGTVGLFERVVPITNREQFLSVAEDIFTVINEWFIGKYVMADIGTKFFMNWGIRESMGPVLLDYPYCYELDGNKLFCAAPNAASPTGRCEGEIDYDAGYNFLVCKKCGSKYKAKELEKKIKNKMIVTKGARKAMGIIVSGGSMNFKPGTVLGGDTSNAIETKEEVKSTPRRPERTINGASYTDFRAAKEEEKKEEPKEEIVEEVVKEEEPAPTTKEEVEAVKDELTPTLKEVVNAIGEDKEKDRSGARKMVTFGEKTEDTVDHTPHVELAEKYAQKMLEEIKAVKFDNIKEDLVVRTLKSLVDNIYEVIDSSCSNKEFFQILMDTLYKGYRHILDTNPNAIEELDDVFVSESALKLVSENYFVFSKKEEEVDENLNQTCVEVKSYIKYVAQDNTETIVSEAEDPEIIYISNDLLKNNSNEATETNSTTTVNVESDEEDSSIADSKTKTYTSIGEYDAELIDIKNLFPDLQPRNVIVIKNLNGDYVTIDNGTIIAINTINNQNVDALSIVSNKYLNELKKAANIDSEDDKKPAPVGALPTMVNKKEG